MILITGFNPGIDPLTPGVILDCKNMVPTISGMVSEKNGENVGVDAIPENILEAETLIKTDDIARTFAGSQTKLYELAGTSWVDRSRAGGYTTTPAGIWRFCQFGNISIAVNKTDVPQESASLNFANLAGNPPKASICETAAGFVILFDYDDGTNSFNDGWWCSGLYNHTTWVPSSASQAANGRLLDTPGSIVAGKRLGSSIIAYKKDSMYIGQYVGVPIIWSWQQISNDTGAFSHEAVVSTENKHYFMGNNGIFVYDGSRPMPIGGIEIRRWLHDNINQTLLYKVKGGYDKDRSLIYWFFPSLSSSGELDKAIVYNVLTNKFGLLDKKIKAIVNYISPVKTWLQIGFAPFPLTWGSYSNSVSWVSSLLLGGSVGFSYIDINNNIIKNNGGLSLDSSITTGDSGNDTFYSTFKRCRAHFIKAPSSAKLTHFHKSGSGNILNNGATVTMSDNKFDLLKSSRFHRIKLDFTGDVEITSYELELKQNGTR